jgi:flagellar motility protein MotE (MotC chaperone)
MPEEQQSGEMQDETTEQADERETTDVSGLKAALDKERKERREHEKRAKELETWKRNREQADLSDTERRDARIKELESKEQEWEREKRDLRLQTAITAAGTKAGALYPEQLHRLVDGSAIEWNEAGQPRNLTSIVNAMKTEFPALFRSHGGAGNADAGAGNGAAPADVSMNALIRRAAGRE